MASKGSPSIGIDLGTTNSCVAVFHNGRVEVIANSQGNRTTPSVVAFDKDGDRLIGEGAVTQKRLDPENAIFNVKRFIGRAFDDPGIADDKKEYPCKIEGKNNKIQFQLQKGSISLTPEETSAAILSKMKKTAEDYLSEEVKDAVITVPAYFTDAQRQATKDAGTIAGLNVTRIINEPTAAALAFGLQEKASKEDDMNVLVYDLGGGTFDVSVLSMEEDIFQVKATHGDTHLGGEDINQELVKHFSREILHKNNVDIGNDKKALHRLSNACEQLKHNLSADNVTESTLALDSFLPDGSDFNSTLTRARFEHLCQPLLRTTLDCVDKVLEDAKLSKDDVTEIILVGGSTKIPKVQAMLKEFFNDKKLNKSVNPDEAVACGAAIQAAILNNDQHYSVQDLLLVDVNPLSLGMCELNKSMHVFVERNTTLPFHLLTAQINYLL